MKPLYCAYCQQRCDDAKHPHRLYCSRRCAGLGQPKVSRLMRFLAKVQKSKKGCWLWTEKLNREGYGIFSENHRQTSLARIKQRIYDTRTHSLPDDMIRNSRRQPSGHAK